MREICFAQLESGREVAYQIVSECDGPTIVHVPDGTRPIEVLSDDPMYDRFLRTLGRYGRLITFDRPGIGASDGFDPDRRLREQNSEAFVAVLDAVGVESAWHVAKGGWGVSALAVDHRARIDGAVMLSARTPRAVLASAHELARVLERASSAGLHDFIPSRADDPTYVAWLERAGRIGASAADARALYEAALAALSQFVADGEHMREVAVPLPVAVVHRRKAQVTTLEDCEWWINRFPGAELIVIDGVDDCFEGVDAGTLADVIGTFITGKRVVADDDRPLVAVMFSDLVQSTARAAAVGDTTWRSMLDRYERHLIAVVERHHGTFVKFTGDGGLATFPSGSRAVRAATELRAGTTQIGLEDRIGIHLGEIEQRLDDVGGLAVHLAARVMGLAKPGQILVTSAVAQTTLGSPTNLESIGLHDLKGFDQPWELFTLAD